MTYAPQINLVVYKLHTDIHLVTLKPDNITHTELYFCCAPGGISGEDAHWHFRARCVQPSSARRPPPAATRVATARVGVSVRAAPRERIFFTVSAAHHQFPSNLFRGRERNRNSTRRSRDHVAAVGVVLERPLLSKSRPHLHGYPVRRGEHDLGRRNVHVTRTGGSQPNGRARARVGRVQRR